MDPSRSDKPIKRLGDIESSILDTASPSHDKKDPGISSLAGINPNIDNTMLYG